MLYIYRRLASPLAPRYEWRGAARELPPSLPPSPACLRPEGQTDLTKSVTMRRCGIGRVRARWCTVSSLLAGPPLITPRPTQAQLAPRSKLTMHTEELLRNFENSTRGHSKYLDNVFGKHETLFNFQSSLKRCF